MLTLKQIKEIFTGEIVSWKILDWKDKKIVAHSQENNSEHISLLQRTYF